jgi:hypothetical protein
MHTRTSYRALAAALSFAPVFAGCRGDVVCPERGCNVCGGIAGRQCAPSEYCYFPDGSCGGAGVCMPRPDTCPVFEESGLCGCDGKVYTTGCEAAQAGVDVSANGGCMLEPGQFACGYRVCFDVNSQYCQITKSDVGGIPDPHFCVSLPSSCTASVPPGGPTCDCLANEPCGGAGNRAEMDSRLRVGSTTYTASAQPRQADA